MMPDTSNPQSTRQSNIGPGDGCWRAIDHESPGLESSVSRTRDDDRQRGARSSGSWIPQTSGAVCHAPDPPSFSKQPALVRPADEHAVAEGAEGGDFRGPQDGGALDHDQMQADAQLVA